MMEQKPMDLYEFLVESELQQYYNSIRNELKISMVSHLKYASDEDLKQVGLSRPEIRRLRKFYEKCYPHGYFSKIKRLLQAPVAKEHGIIINPSASPETLKSIDSPAKAPNNKHIIPADSICVNKQLGIGEFGIVQQGVWTNGNERIQVAIKCLSRERMQSNPMEFLKEAAIMHAIEHENIVRLYGVVLDTESLMLVTELAHLRSLLECLKDSGLRVNFLTVPTLCEFAMQICNGMMYLENKRLIHRDLASRNVLVFSKDKVKISDFGLSRALGVGKDYYQTNFNTFGAMVCVCGKCFPMVSNRGLHLLDIKFWRQLIIPTRLEAPECAPREYYSLMLKCWEHTASKRPKFSEIYAMLPDMKPEQLKTIVGSTEPAKKEFLYYRQNEIITVLDKSTNSPYWKGVLNSGKTGLFNPANTVTYLGSLPSSTNRDSFCRSNDRSSKRKLRTEMISRPQNDLKHTGHVGLDGAYFGDIAFMSNMNYNHVPRQIVTPYKPSEDIEQTPLLLPPTPTSPDSMQTASGYFPETMNSTFASSSATVSSNTNDNFSSVFEFPNQSSASFNPSNPFILHDNVSSTQRHKLPDGSFLEEDKHAKDQRHANFKWSNTAEASHEYHEISDDEMAPDKFDLGPSLLDEMDYMFRSMSAGTSAPKASDFDTINKKNEMTDLTSKLHRKTTSPGLSATLGPLSSKSKKKSGTVKPISNKDEKILNQAIDFANEISARSMTDLVSDNSSIAQSPKRKFSFRFPNLSHHSSIDKDPSSPLNGGHTPNTNMPTYSNRNRNFSEEIKNVPDLQSSISEESREAYNRLVEKTSSKAKCHFDFDKAKIEGMDMDNLVAIEVELSPRQATRKQKLPLELKMSNEFDVPSHPAPRPTTLPWRNVTHDKQNEDIDSSPLRILRDKNYPIIRPRIKINSTNSDLPSRDSLNVDSVCESPSYLTQPEYSFSEKDINIQRCSLSKQSATKEIENFNPAPLPPPKDRSKIMQANVKRHVRKHPLIIPGSVLQRQLNKVKTPSDEKNLQFPSSSSNSNYNTNSTKRSDVSKLKELDHSYMNQNELNNSFYYAQKNTDTNHFYTNMDTVSYEVDCTDSASLDFESILENDVNKVGEVSSPEVFNGFPFDIQKDDSSVKNFDVERRKFEFLHIYPKHTQSKNELDQNALFNKIKSQVEANNVDDAGVDVVGCSSTVDSNVDENLSDSEKHLTKKSFSDSNAVSCEDLLEFSDKKPKGRERGVESDEVRIMTKVLGTEESADKFLIALDFIDWDVHKAIKIMTLQKTLGDRQQYSFAFVFMSNIVRRIQPKLSMDNEVLRTSSSYALDLHKLTFGRKSLALAKASFLTQDSKETTMKQKEKHFRYNIKI
ncbi:Activated Cdc42 kinase-like [Pseudolycoriella hygida]|uniref:non-specific protein-tyrosine kinase n=1 Tax=Pseudolycoriella hygida TaxID=35572 RepID=A0A9Q0S2C4_9DIPT|nr:Activated Cdc42 kinase-like [Pseudolycoriella hygida]